MKDAISSQETYSKVIQSIPETARFWWLEPSEETWAKFEFHELTNVTRLKWMESLKNAKYEKNADNYTLLEIPLAEKKARGTGILVIDLGNGDSLCLRLRATRVNRAAIGFVTVKNFDASKKSAVWNSVKNAEFDGIVLDLNPINLLPDKAKR